MKSLAALKFSHSCSLLLIVQKVESLNVDAIQEIMPNFEMPDRSSFVGLGLIEILTAAVPRG
jgi:hypothetical protein